MKKAKKQSAKKEPPRVIVILGPTASGKSDIAVHLAKKVGGEVISADSRQVYTGLDIGTGKITRREKRGVPHHLLDVASPKKRFSVEAYAKKAEKAVKDILKRKKVPIICGGTGFYIDTLIHGIALPQVPPNAKLRKNLEKKSIEELIQMLASLDRERAKQIDTKNKVRLIRAIEIAKALGKVPRVSRQEKYTVLKIGLSVPQNTLRNKIKKRLEARMRQGMVKEAQGLHRAGLSWKRMEELGLEYRYLALFLQGKISKEEMVEELETKIGQYAKRQMTWFKRDEDTLWLKPSNTRAIEKISKSFLLGKSVDSAYVRT